MPLKWDLSTKALLVLAVPLILQIVLFLVLTKVQAKAERTAEKLDQPVEVLVNLSASFHGLLDLWSGASRSNIDFLMSPECDQIRRNTMDSLSRLEDVLKDMPDERKAAQSIRGECQELMNQLLAREDEIIDSAGMPRAKRLTKYAPLEHLMEEVFHKAAAMQPVSDKMSATANRTITAWNHFDRQYELTLQIGVAVEILLVCGCALLFGNDIGSRIKVMKDNTYRIASQRPLNSRIKGSDELARLDAVFHEMAGALVESVRNEMAIAENARDVICSLNDKLSFIDVNHASAVVLGYQPHELMQMRLANILPPEDVSSAFAFFTQSKTRPEDSFELRVRRSDNTLVDTLWSVTWSSNEHLFFCVAHDNTARKESERQRNELIQLVTDDLKTPLSTLNASLDTLRSERYGALSERGKQLLTIAVSATSQMLTLINDLLDIEQIEAGTLKIRPSLNALEPIFAVVKEGVSGLARKHNVTVEAKSNGLNVYCDRDRMVQILINLISNAVKFSPPGATVTVGAEASQASVRIDVIDRGRGIPLALQGKIFERFRQVEVSDAREKGGSGLGLAICKALVKAHGGDIQVESSEGAGSKFSFRLPNKPEGEERVS